MDEKPGSKRSRSNDVHVSFVVVVVVFVVFVIYLIVFQDEAFNIKAQALLR